MRQMLLIFLLFLSSCATSFTGDAKVNKKYCVAQCKAWGMKLGGMFAAGEYSNGCICVDKKAKVSAEVTPGVTAAVSGVITQIRAQQAAAAGGGGAAIRY